MPILTTNPSTAKERAEHPLLVSLRFACLTTKHRNPMDCPRVQQRVAELNRLIPPKPAIDKLYVNRAGELGPSFVLRVNGSNYQATLWRSSHHAAAIHPLFSHAIA
ncbi:hypothetical protein [Shewanella fodinae]|uniref:hypothetical protein n=1 Tax=Shewanella fodinae TaxID=552357 RepID=UPI00167A0F34|nr:hypothetical protein [Shewanella fodinae]MCL2905595.1 hypothetical protein [Shewanella fodinae]GGY92263.1 hypothetical protein GCM10007169_06870 [Shewanella fodinae]